MGKCSKAYTKRWMNVNQTLGLLVETEDNQEAKAKKRLVINKLHVVLACYTLAPSSLCLTLTLSHPDSELHRWSSRRSGTKARRETVSQLQS